MGKTLLGKMEAATSPSLRMIWKSWRGRALTALVKVVQCCWQSDQAKPILERIPCRSVLECSLESQEGGAASQRAQRGQSLESLVGRKRVKVGPL